MNRKYQMDSIFPMPGEENRAICVPGTSGPERIDNVTDTALRAFHVRYADDSISKDDVSDYIYGVLHAPDWRGRFADDLFKELPRVPFAERWKGSCGSCASARQRPASSRVAGTPGRRLILKQGVVAGRRPAPATGHEGLVVSRRI